MTDETAPLLLAPSLQALCAVNTAQPWCIDLMQPELSGRRTTASDLDAISARPDATALRVSGLDQKTFELLVTRHGSQFDAIYFWKSGRSCRDSETTPALSRIEEAGVTGVAVHAKAGARQPRQFWSMSM